MEIVFKNSLAFIKQNINEKDASKEKLLDILMIDGNEKRRTYILSEKDIQKLLDCKSQKDKMDKSDYEELKTNTYKSIELIRDFSVDSESDKFGKFIKEMIGDETTDVGSIRSSITSSASTLSGNLAGFYHDTRANSGITSFYKVVGGKREVYALGFHAKHGTRSYTIDAYWQVDDSRFGRNKVVSL